MYYTTEAPWRSFPLSKRNLRKEHENLRVIKTARTISEINEAVTAGFFPCLTWHQRHKNIFSVVSGLLVDEGNGELSWDTRRHSGFLDPPPGTHRVFQGERYYPYQFPSPFAAYLIPMDLSIGEMVWLDDLIEDIPAELSSTSFLGLEGCRSVSRIPSAPATWRGQYFEVHYTPETEDRSGWVG